LKADAAIAMVVARRERCARTSLEGQRFADAGRIAIAASAFKLVSRTHAQGGRPGDGADEAKDLDGKSGLEPSSGMHVLDVSPHTTERARAR